MITRYGILFIVLPIMTGIGVFYAIVNEIDMSPIMNGIAAGIVMLIIMVIAYIFYQLITEDI